jgi:hypothetical protein
VDPSKTAPASPVPPNRRKSLRLMPEVDRASGGVRKHLEHISPPSDAAPQQATRSRSMYQTHRQLRRIRTGAGRLANATRTREPSGKMLGLQGVCAAPPSLYLSAIWSAQRAPADLIAGARVSGFAHEDWAGQDAVVTAFRDPPPDYRVIREWFYAAL